ncbi:hypothetical protein PPSIR1_04743 [Plesiocystis pacifica SIR-1]|uniref:Siderophore synthetase component n=1 Tax=Plesiocystis pacifica SIR-1 TaxID=391625 RepID=A6FWS1_9BACT|nr:IucA/IucC family protein [Plesiocystis pacifica]EDM81745.1 hypothetical protein PPSIR1_04743 [Plesiocystis pacifica SIR-1]
MRALPTAAEVDHQAEARAARWIRRVLAFARGPLAELAPASELEPAALARCWRGAALEIGARVVLSSVREGLVPGEREPASVRWHDPALGAPLVLPLRRWGAFGLDLPELSGALDPRLLDPAGLIALPCARADCGPGDLARVRAELDDSVDKLAWARLAQRLRPALAQRSPEDPRVRDPEHLVTDGHPWHPMTRTRVGLGAAANLRHAPELLGRAWISTVEVAASEVQRAGTWDALAVRCFGAPRDPGWVRIPVHPTQRRLLPRLFPELVARGALRTADGRPFRAPPDPSQALAVRSLLSLRTVTLEDRALPFHLKLATNIHTTSAKRVVSAMSVTNGPRVSALLERIQAQDPKTQSLEIMVEPAAAGLDPARHSRASSLGAILRRAPSRSDGAQAWVCAAVAEPWPLDPSQRVLERLASGYPGDAKARLRALLGDWIALLVPPCLRLLTVHGVALEVHLQNTLARVAQGRLVGFAVRDLGGIRIHTPRLTRAGHTLSLAPESFIWTDDLPEVRGKLEHTLFHAHLTHVFAVAEALSVPAGESWARTRTVVEGCLTRWGGERAREDLEAMLAPTVRAKALLSMRLRERSSDYDYTRVDNPLSA